MNIPLLQRHVGLLRNLLEADEDAACALTASWTVAEWEGCLEFLYEHRLRECFWYCLERLPLVLGRVPPRIRKKLEQCIPRTTRRIQTLDNLLYRAGDALTARGIEWQVLKGTPLTARFFPPGQLRHQGDVDLLVRETELAAAVDCLRSVGLRLRGDRRTIAPGRLRAEHAASLSDGTSSIDLHWKLRSGPDYRIAMDAVWQTKQTWHGPRGPVATLCDEYLIVLLCLSLAHDLGRGGVRLKSFLALHYVLRQCGHLTETADFRHCREREGIASVCRQTLEMVETVFPGTPGGSANRPAGNLQLTRQDDHLPPSRELVWRLVAGPRGAVENFLWFARLHRLWKPSHLVWHVQKHVPHAGRIPVAGIRLLRFGGRLAQWALTRAPYSQGQSAEPQQQPARTGNPHRREAA